MPPIFHEVILPLFILVIAIIGAFFVLKRIWKSHDETVQLAAGVIYLGEYSKEEKIRKIRNSGTRDGLVVIWLFTIPTGILGIWSNITAPLLISLSICLTIGCAISMIKRKYYNISSGICFIYFGYLCLLAAFKFGYWEFALSYWWFVIAIVLNTINYLLAFWSAIKSKKKVLEPNNEIIKSFKGKNVLILFISIFPGITPFIGMAHRRYVEEHNIGNETAVPVMMSILILVAIFLRYGVNAFVMDDSEYLKHLTFVGGKEDE